MHLDAFLLSRLHPRFAHIDTRKTQTDRLARAYFSARAKDSASEETNAS